MGNAEFDEVIELFARHIVKETEGEGWLEGILEKKGFDLSEISEEDRHSILVKTILMLYDEFEEDIEAEEEEEEEEAEEEEEGEDYEEEDDDA
jgi:hypothetical protein